jgi:DNA-binding transcriptional MerR regulator
MAPSPTPRLLKIGELARAAGVPSATVKHYLREGLLPGPAKRTGRNMAYYHPALVERVRAIKELQTRRFLPLKVIGEMLEAADPYRTDETQAALGRALASMSPLDAATTRRALLDSGVSEVELAFFESIGFVTPITQDGEVGYAGDDVALLRTLRAARRRGLSPEMLPHTIVARYVGAIRELVRAELEMFREGVANVDASAELEPLVRAAASLSEELVVTLRRKLLLPMLDELAHPPKNDRRSPTHHAAPPPNKRRPRRAGS